MRASEPLEPNGGQRSCIVEDLPTLVWLANLAALELHTNQWKLPDVNRPRAVVLDLDPGAPADVLDCCRVAIELREMLDTLGLIAVVKTSGGKGLHISVPLNGAKVDRRRHQDVRARARAVARRLAIRSAATVNMAKAERKGRVFIDWSQNDRHKTTICAYSLRIADRPTCRLRSPGTRCTTRSTAATQAALVFEAPDVLERVGRRRRPLRGVAHHSARDRLP